MLSVSHGCLANQLIVVAIIVSTIISKKLFSQLPIWDSFLVKDEFRRPSTSARQSLTNAGEIDYSMAFSGEYATVKGYFEDQ